MSDDPGASRVVRGKYFWVPFWLAIATATGVAGFLCGEYSASEAARDRDVAALATAAMRNPAEAIQDAERKLLTQKIDFDVYRDMIQAALKKPEIQTVDAAFQSMSHVIDADNADMDSANKRDTAKLIEGMNPVVLLALPSDSERVAGLDKELRAFNIDTVLATRNDDSKDNAVICYVVSDEHRGDVKYNDATCNESAERVKALLAKRGYDIDQVTRIKRPNAAYGKRIDVILAPIAGQKSTNNGTTPKSRKKPKHRKHR